MTHGLPTAPRTAYKLSADLTPFGQTPFGQTFLFQAGVRNCKFAKPPRLIFLHGNVALGYCADHRVKGPAGTSCGICGRPYVSSRLLYPVNEKNYTSDPFISSEWMDLQSALSDAYVFTIFGYSAPQSDVEAIELLRRGWGRPETRELEQVEIIDLKADDELRERWDSFIVEHHYDTEKSFYSSWIARHPRRSCGAVWRQTMEVEFLVDNPIPQLIPFDQQLEWYKRLIDAEHATGTGVSARKKARKKGTFGIYPVALTFCIAVG